MCIEFQHLRCQVVAIKGLAYLLPLSCSWFCYCSFSREQRKWLEIERLD